MNFCNSPRASDGALPASVGMVTGSMPSRRKLRPPIAMRPSTIGDTGQPARRKSANSFCGIATSLLATSIAVRAPPNTAAARS